MVDSWIVFSKRKPPPFKQVIVQRKRRNEVTAAYYQSCRVWGHQNRFSIERGGNLSFTDVVYWQPLPKAHR